MVCESLDALPSLESARNFCVAIDMLQNPLERYLEKLYPRPSCIISDRFVHWTADTAKKYRIPWIIFDGMSCFIQLCTHNLHVSKVYERVSDTEPFVVPGMPDRIELMRVQLPSPFNPGMLDMSDYQERIREAELGAYGVMINSFEELEQQYVNEFKKVEK